MNKISIPVFVKDDTNLDELVGTLKKAKAQRVFIASERPPFGNEELQDMFAKQLSKNKEKFEKNDIEVAVWINTMGMGVGSVKKYNADACKNYMRKMSISGVRYNDSFCPLDRQFVGGICSYVQKLAANGFEMIMLDDDFTLSASPGIGCCCELHMNEFRRRIGENIRREELAAKVFTGGKNAYRDAWFEMMNDTLKEFCRDLRMALDCVNPNARLGFCAGFTSWDLDGADVIELTDILAGKTKPFLRLTGAPYWYSQKRFGKYSLQLIAEITRQQVKWCENRRDIEIFSENDSYPRLSAVTPAAHTELFDQMLRVCEGVDSLKYIIDYLDPNRKNRYTTEHMRNMELYKKISDVFDDKECIGVRIYENAHLLKDAELSPDFKGEASVTNRWFNQAAQIPSIHAVPITYNGSGICGMVFGENAKYLPADAFEKGLIIDLKAAQILQNNGIDVGLISKKKITENVFEHFADYDTKESLYANTTVYNIETRPGARVISVFVGETDTYPSAYLYQNDSGQRFMVYAFDIQDVLPQSGLLVSPSRGMQLNDSIEFLAGRRMPVVCSGNPLLYCICKQGENSCAAAYFNCSDEEIINAQIELSFTPKKIRFINCDGFESDGGVTVSRILPYKMAAIEFVV